MGTEGREQDPEGGDSPIHSVIQQALMTPCQGHREESDMATDLRGHAAEV